MFARVALALIVLTAWRTGFNGTFMISAIIWFQQKKAPAFAAPGPRERR
jgi:hypothetical protein